MEPTNPLLVHLQNAMGGASRNAIPATYPGTSDWGGNPGYTGEAQRAAPGASGVATFAPTFPGAAKGTGRSGGLTLPNQLPPNTATDYGYASSLENMRSPNGPGTLQPPPQMSQASQGMMAADQNQQGQRQQQLVQAMRAMMGQ